MREVRGNGGNITTNHEMFQDVRRVGHSKPDHASLWYYHRQLPQELWQAGANVPAVGPQVFTGQP